MAYEEAPSVGRGMLSEIMGGAEPMHTTEPWEEKRLSQEPLRRPPMSRLRGSPRCDNPCNSRNNRCRRGHRELPDRLHRRDRRDFSAGPQAQIRTSMGWAQRR